MLEVISSYIDLELAIIILAGILSAIFLNVIFRKISMPIGIHWLVILCVVGVIGFFGYNYLEKEEVEYFESVSSNYIVGKVQFVGKSVDKIRIKYVKGNIPISKKGEIVVHVNGMTKYLLKRSYEPEVSISIDNLKIGDNVTVYCKENSLMDGKNEITAKKIIKKES